LKIRDFVQAIQIFQYSSSIFALLFHETNGDRPTGDGSESWVEWERDCFYDKVFLRWQTSKIRYIVSNIQIFTILFPLFVNDLTKTQSKKKKTVRLHFGKAPVDGRQCAQV
jgi:hypothetical protein